MDILDMIKKDHTEAKTLLNKIEEESSHSSLDLIQKFATEVILHSKSEQDSLYKTLLRHGDEKLRDFAIEGLFEHQLVEHMLNTLIHVRSSGTADKGTTTSDSISKMVQAMSREMGEQDESIPKEAASSPKGLYDSRFRAALKVTKDLLLMHMEEEENEMFPLIKRSFSEDILKDMGQLMNEAKSQHRSHIQSQ